MKTVSVLSRVEGGKLMRNRRLLNAAISHFEGKEIEIIIKRKYKKRSLPQNAFYWGVTLPFFQNLLLDHWGEIKSIDEVHEILKALCNYKEIPNPTTGEIEKIPLSTTELTTSGWMDYEHKIEQFCLDFFNTPVPKPNEQLTFSLQ